MPVAAAIVPAVIGAGASIYSASQQKKAAGKALDAQSRAADQQLQLQRESRDLAVSLNEPFRQGGLSAFDALLAEYGLGGSAPAAPAPAAPAARPAMATAGTGAPAGAQPGFGFGDMTAEQRAGWVGTGNVRQAPSAAGKPDGGFAGTSPLAPTATVAPAAPTPDFNAYVQSDPAIMAEFNRNMASGKGREYLSSLGISTPEDFGRWHYDTYGRNEGRTLPMTQPAAPTTPTGQGPATPQGPSPANPPTDLMTANRPAWEAPPEFTRPDDIGGPGAFVFDPSKIAEDPGYQFRLKEGLNAVNAASAARGKLRSGDAAMALQARGEGLASQETQNAFERAIRGWGANTDLYRYQQSRADNIFADDRAYDTGMWQYQGERGDRNFETDRAYQTSRYDTRIGNLFSLAGIGQSAAGAITGAQSNYAANAGNIFGAQANAAADAAAARANANASIAGGLASGAGNLFAAWGGGARGGGMGGTTVGSAWNTATGGGWQSPYNPSFVNTPSSIRF